MDRQFRARRRARRLSPIAREQHWGELEYSPATLSIAVSLERLANLPESSSHGRTDAELRIYRRGTAVHLLIHTLKMKEYLRIKKKFFNKRVDNWPPFQAQSFGG